MTNRLQRENDAARRIIERMAAWCLIGAGVVALSIGAIAESWQAWLFGAIGAGAILIGARLGADPVKIAPKRG